MTGLGGWLETIPAGRRNVSERAAARRSVRLRSLLAAVLLAAGGSAGGAADNAAPALPVLEGLELHWDASALAAQRQPDPASPPQGGAPVETWPDLSGHERHAQQPDAEARPSLLRVGRSAVLRFDGQNDHLRALDLNQTWEAATLFLIAAPRENLGGFRGFLAANERGRRDFETGFTIDLGPAPTTAFTQLNVEGRGFVGARSLAQSSSPFGTLHVLEVVFDPAARTVSLTVDGSPAGARPWEPAPLRADELTIGARYYNLFGPQQHVTGWIAADIAEIALYSRVLTAEEARLVREHLLDRHAELKRELPATLHVEGRVPLESIPDPPPVQLFVPGFEVRELPLRLPNLNNVRYRPDGKLLAVAYNGNVYVLSDADGDGLEDQAELFWENPGRVRSPIGMALTPPGYRLGDGLFVATKSECLLLADTDGDDRADREVVVADGWPESFQNVDALGVAVDPQDESIYFGLGTANFTDPLLRNPAGEALYRLEGERGAILKVSPDFSRREVFCTGIRFPVALAFNREGDLFATDQEGATWVPNGNPFDELLHIQRGRHYGFPARHPKHLPGVIDEPSVYDYAPQHQSTCGLTFNEPAGDGAAFGPPSWRGDALVCGYSRGKLYRTRLVKTPAGYVADNRILACLNHLTVDACVAPRGGLVIAVHSGGPDWGSGPSGEGKLYQVRYAEPEAPQPAAAWPAGPNEVHIAFDRPLDPQHLRGLLEGTRIVYGEHVRAGDEFESLRPGYEVVARQMAAPRRELRVHSVQVAADRRTLMLATDRQREAVCYAIRLPGLGRPPLSTSPPAPGEPLPQHPRVDLDYTLHGVQATWEDDEGAWVGWLPHLDLSVSRSLMQESAPHEALRERMQRRGRLRLQTQLDLQDMLRPAVQPGSRLDYELPPETVTVVFTASAPFRVATPGKVVESARQGAHHTVALRREPPQDDWLPLDVTLEAAAGGLEFTVAWQTDEDDRPRPLPLRRMILPWAERRPSPDAPGIVREIPELAGGSWSRGRRLFFSETAQCSKCHRVRGAGETIGPDLSNLIHRDYASVFRDVADPSFAINPDYITHSVVLADGRLLSGTLRSEADRVLVSDAQARVVAVDRSEIEMLVPSAQSIMPDGLTRKLAPEELRDLLTFLLLPPPQMPRDHPQPPPPPRTGAELAAVLAGAPEPPEPTRPIRVVLVAGPKDHGPGEHDYPAWQQAWGELLRAADDVAVGAAWEWPSADDFATADVLVFYQHGTWSPERARDIDAFLARGGGLVYIHYAVDGGNDAPGFAQRIGLAWRGGQSKFRHGPLELGFETGDRHPIGRNFSRVNFVDESYWNLAGDPSRIRPLAFGIEEGEPRPLFWTLESGRGRVFVSIPGHFSWTFDDPLFRVLLLRGIAWAAREPVDRFNELATMGARLETSGSP